MRSGIRSGSKVGEEARLPADRMAEDCAQGGPDRPAGRQASSSRFHSEPGELKVRMAARVEPESVATWG